MARNKDNDIFPPLDNKRAKMQRLFSKLCINLLVLLGAGTLYYVIFAMLFDTSEEYALRKSTERLTREYERLSARIDEVEAVLDNVARRDSNVFEIMFEAEPNDNDYTTMRGERRATLMALDNTRLGQRLEKHTASLEQQLHALDSTFSRIHAAAQTLNDRIYNIPSIQPVINDGLTLLTASFGMRMHPFYKSLTPHNGVDFTVPEGSRVFATADGVVKEAARRPSSTGFTVVINHGNGYETRYNHLEKILVRQGQHVSRGDIIALSGNSGLSLVPHLHYEVRYEGEPVDPVNYFYMELTATQYDRLKHIARSGMQSFD